MDVKIPACVEDYERFVPIQLAVKMRDKGFDEPQRFAYELETTDRIFMSSVPMDTKLNNNYVWAPTQQSALDWISRKFNLEISLSMGFVEGDTKLTWFWCPIKILEGRLEYPMQKDDDPNMMECSSESKENAINDFIEYCLYNLL